MAMTREQIKTALANIRSGKYKKGRGRMIQIDESGDVLHCIQGAMLYESGNYWVVLSSGLGVCEEVLTKEYPGFDRRARHRLEGANDNTTMTLAQMADIVEYQIIDWEAVDAAA